MTYMIAFLFYSMRRVHRQEYSEHFYLGYVLSPGDCRNPVYIAANSGVHLSPVFILSTHSGEEIKCSFSFEGQQSVDIHPVTAVNVDCLGCLADLRDLWLDCL